MASGVWHSRICACTGVCHTYVDWCRYMNWLQNISAVMPYMVLPGNHESECHSPVCLAEETKYAKPLSNFSAFNSRWSMPSAESGGSRDTNMWCEDGCFVLFCFCFVCVDVHYSGRTVHGDEWVVKVVVLRTVS